MKKIISLSFFVVFIICIAVLPIKAAAMRKPFATDIEVCMDDFPEEAAYFDLLIDFSNNDSNYTENNSENLERYDFDPSQLLEYESEGYKSMSAHYSGLYTRMTIDHEKKEGKVHDDYFEFAPVIDGYGTGNAKEQFMMTVNEYYSDVKLVLLNKDGEIIKETAAISIKQDREHTLDHIYWNVAADYADAEFYDAYSYGKAKRNGFLLIMTAGYILLLSFIFISVKAVGFLFSRLTKKPEK